MIAITIEYFAQLREQAGCGRETLQTDAPSIAALYSRLRRRHAFQLDPTQLKVAVNAQFRDWSHPLADGDVVVFIPPVAGG